MAKFLTDLEVKVLKSRTFTQRPLYKLSHELQYQSDWYPTIITIPVGFTTDFASVPNVSFLWGLFGDVADKSAVIHDYLYKNHIDKDTADNIFWEAMSIDDPPVPYIPRWIIYQAVHLFGKP